MGQRYSALLAAMVALAVGSARADVFTMPNGQTSLQFVTVGDPGNVGDTAVMDDGTTGYGSVPYVYQMGKYDVTVGQYCQFLNAVAKTDTYGLYNSDMATDMPTVAITQSGSPGSYGYSVTGSYSQGVNCPMFAVSWADAARFSNWLQNGQPTGTECGTTTENGAYTMQSNLMAITRNAGATYVIPSENEWYKAAYYKGGTTNAGYWTYPTQSNIAPSNELSATGTNNANYINALGFPDGCTDPTNYLTPVGAFADSHGAYGTYDMGGDVGQWNEATIIGAGRGLRGGFCFGGPDDLSSSVRSSVMDPSQWNYGTGFRVASLAVPEPASIVLVVAGTLFLLAYARRRRA